MAIQIGAKPDSGFDDPIGMLKDCHRRIESFLGILCVVVDRAQRQEPYRRRARCDQGCAASTSELAGNATRRMKKNHSSRDCANPPRNPSRRSTGLKMIIARQTICTLRSSGFIQPGLSRAAWVLKKRSNCSPKQGASSNSIPTISKSRRRLFSLARARCWTAARSRQSEPSFGSGGNSILMRDFTRLVLRTDRQYSGSPLVVCLASRTERRS